MRRIVQSVNYLSEATLLFLMCYITADVLLRYVFNRPLRGSMDIGQFGLAVIVFLSLSYTALSKGHVSADIFVSRLSPKKQAIIDAVNSLLGIAIYSVIAWQGLDSALYIRRVGESGGVLNIPTYPFRLLVPFGAILLCLVLVTHITEFIKRFKEGG